MTALMLATIDGDLQLVKDLLAAGANVNLIAYVCPNFFSCVPVCFDHLSLSTFRKQ